MQTPSTDKIALAQLAIGRILRMGSRATQPGDVEEYERCRAIVLDATDEINASWEPNIARDHNRGAAGQ